MVLAPSSTTVIVASVDAVPGTVALVSSCRRPGGHEVTRRWAHGAGGGCRGGGGRAAGRVGGGDGVGDGPVGQVVIEIADALRAVFGSGGAGRYAVGAVADRDGDRGTRLGRAESWTAVWLLKLTDRCAQDRHGVLEGGGGRGGGVAGAVGGGHGKGYGTIR